MKKRLLFKFVKYIFKSAFFLGVFSSVIKTASYINQKYFKEHLRKNHTYKKYHIALVVGTISSLLIFVFSILLFFLRKNKGFYLFNIFDKDRFKAIKPDEASIIENAVRAELNEDICSVPSNRGIPQVPIDTEATEDNLG